MATVYRFSSEMLLQALWFSSALLICDRDGAELSHDESLLGIFINRKKITGLEEASRMKCDTVAIRNSKSRWLKLYHKFVIWWYLDDNIHRCIKKEIGSPISSFGFDFTLCEGCSCIILCMYIFFSPSILPLPFLFLFYMYMFVTILSVCTWMYFNSWK